MGYTMTPLEGSIFIFMYLTQIQYNGYMVIPDMTSDISELLEDTNTRGTIKFSESFITGLSTMKVPAFGEIIVTENTEMGTGTYDVCLPLSMDVMNITTKYVADIALRDRIPVYGAGDLSLSISDVVMDLCTFVNHTGAYVDKLNLQMSYRYGPMSITGLYRHPNVDQVGAKLLENAHISFALWNKYEPEKASCVFSPLMQYILNKSLRYELSSLTFNSTCLQESSFGKIWENLRDSYQELHDLL